MPSLAVAANADAWRSNWMAVGVTLFEGCRQANRDFRLQRGTLGSCACLKGSRKNSLAFWTG
jgi:hypothetical protein